MYSDIDKILSWCLISPRYNNLICNNDYFWRRKYINDFGQPEENVQDWKLLYQRDSSGKMYITGKNEYMFDMMPVFFNALEEEREEKHYGNTMKLKDVAFGSDGAIGIDTDSNVWIYVNNKYIKTYMRAKSCCIGFGFYAIIDLEDNVQIFKRNDPLNPTLMPINSKGKRIFAYRNFFAFIDDNNNGFLYDILQLYQGEFLGSNIKQIAIADKYIFILNIDGNLWYMRNIFDTNTISIFPGLVDPPADEQQLLFMGAKEIGAGVRHLIILDVNNNIWGIGSNDHYQIGIEGGEEGNELGYQAPRFTNPIRISDLQVKTIAVGPYHNLILSTNNDVYVFGENSEGQLLVLDSNVKTMTKLPNIKAIKIFTGYDQSAILGRLIWNT